MTKKQKRLAAVADALWEWLSQDKSVSLPKELGITHNRARAALFARDWEPSLQQLAKIEAAIDEPVLPLKQ